MRAAILLIPLAAFAAYSAGAPPTDPYGYNAQAAAEQDIANAEAAADMAMDAAASNDSMDMGMDANMMDMPGNSMGPAPPPRLAWMGGDMWLIAAEEPSGAIWYFDPLRSDFTVTPFRVILHTDESRVAGARYSDTERVIALDCAARSYHVLSTSHHGAAANATPSLESGDPSTIRPAPGSVWAAVVDTVCRHDANQEAQRTGNEVTFNGM